MTIEIESSTIVAQWICEGCGYVYDEADGDPRSGIAPGTPFEALSADVECPSCGGLKDGFVPLTMRIP
jgi:rubredoxin